MNSKMMTLALAAMAGTTTALAAPRETVDVVAANGGNALIGNHLITNVAQTEPVNSVVNVTITGNSGGAYTAKSVRVVGNIAVWGANSYGSETRVRVTAPSGEFVDFSPSSLAATPAGPVAFDLSANLAPATTAGNWVVTIHETFDDASVDATYDVLTVTTDDTAIPVGEPGTFTDLGDFTLAERTVDEVINLGAANEVKWFKMKLPGVVGAGAGYVDMWATQADPAAAITANDLTDTDLALYSASSAALVTYNDATGPGLFGQLSYGSTVSRGITTATGQTNGAALAGGNGALAEGFYYLAVAQYNMAHPANIANNWTAVTSNYTGAARNTALHIRSLPNTAPSNPSVTTLATPATVANGGTSLLTVTVTGGLNPASTGITVSGDLSSIGGSATQTFYDDGTNGDAVAGNGVYSYSTTVTAAPGPYSLPVVATDAQLRSGTGNIALTVSAPTAMTLNGGVAPSAVTSTSVLVTATVTPGGFPASSGVTVTADLTSMGGSATAAMFDDGTNGDVVAGNNVYSLEVPFPAAGTYSIVLNAADAQSRTATKTISLLYKDAGDIAGTDTDLSTIDVITSSMASSVGNVAWMKFNLTEGVSNDADDATIGMFLDIDTETTGADAAVIGTLSDTELGLYRADGSFVATDDDDGSYFHSMLSFGDVAPNRTAQGVAPNAGVVGNGRDGALTAGVYFMAIANYNAVFNPGFGASTPNTAAEAGDFVVNFRTNIPGETRGGCSAADVGMAGGEPGQDNLLDNNDFIAFINFFFEQNPIADQGVAGGEYGSDGLYDNNDFIAFINHFFEDAANCNG